MYASTSRVSAPALPGYHDPATVVARIAMSLPCDTLRPTREPQLVGDSIRGMSQNFTREDLERVARLARLELDPSEQDLFARQVAGILEYADQIQKVDTTDVEPTS